MTQDELVVWVQRLDALEDDDLRLVRDAVKAEFKRRKLTRPLSARTLDILADLHKHPPTLVAKKWGVSRQHCYQLCRAHGITPVRRRS